jgi:pimeloyl-ACP methyl ester carboxylesterase
MLTTIDGTAVATAGRPLEAGRLPLFLLHGAGQDGSVWGQTARHLSHRGWIILVPDLPGHGRSRGTPLATVDALADWLAGLADRLAVPRFALAGHSLGGLVALEAAARHPARIAALAVVGAALAMPVHADLLAAAKANSPDAIEMVSLWGLGRDTPSPFPGLWPIGWCRAVMRRARPGVLFADLSACNGYDGGAAAAARVACPSTVVLGQRDAMTPIRAGTALAQAIPGAGCTILADAPHMMPLSAPDALAEALASWLDRSIPA